MLSRTGIRILSLLALVFVMSTGCGEDKNPNAPAEEHFEAEGILLLQGQAVVLKVFQGRLDMTVASELSVGIGVSEKYTMVFLDHDGIAMEEPGHEHESHEEQDHDFGYQISDQQVLRLVKLSTDGEWEFRLQGIQEGSATLELQVLHVGHVDFRTPPIPVRVIPDPS